MNEKIDTKTGTASPEFSPGFTRGLIIATCAILLIIFGAPVPSSTQHSFVDKLLAPAHVIAAGVTVHDGIQEFQGFEIENVPATTKLHLVGLLLLDFVIAPACFLLVWRYAFKKKSQGGGAAAGKGLVWRIRIALIPSGVILAYLCIMYTSGAIVSPQVFRTMVLVNTIDQNRSAIIADLVAIDFQANQYFHLPWKKGGGDHSFRSHLDQAGKSWVTLSELGMPAETGNGTYFIKAIKNDTTLIVRGTGKIRLSDGTYPEYEYLTSPTISVPTKIN